MRATLSTDPRFRSLADSQKHSERIALKSGSNFVRSFSLLSLYRRQAMTALYAFARLADDATDGAEKDGSGASDGQWNAKHWSDWLDTLVEAEPSPKFVLRDAQIVVERSPLAAAQCEWSGEEPPNTPGRYQGACTESPQELSFDSKGSADVSSPTWDLDRIRPALRDAVTRYNIPIASLREIVQGVDVDSQSSLRFEDWQNTKAYCHLVASSVGIACLSIWAMDSNAPVSDSVRQSAMDCGVAFQITNILRDVSEDAKRDRIYIPLNDLQQCKLSADQWLNRGKGAAVHSVLEQSRFQSVVRLQLERARALYERGLGVLDYLSPDGRRMFLLMWSTYRKLLEKISSNPDIIWSKRTSLSNREKLVLGLRHAFTPWFQRSTSRLLRRSFMHVQHSMFSSFESHPARSQDVFLDASPTKRLQSVAVVGGGLGGIQAALHLARHGMRVTLFEAKHRLGGRVGSFQDHSTDQQIDYCQHVGLKCCSSLVQWIQETNQQEYWEEQSELHFIAPSGKKIRIASLPLPAPFHLSGLLLKWPGLTSLERIRVTWALACLLRHRRSAETDNLLALKWLQGHHQTEGCIRKFWATILVSALGDQVHRVTLGAMHKVLIDGFAASRDAFHLLVPKLPLSSLLDLFVTRKLEEEGVAICLGTPVHRIERGNSEGVSIDVGSLQTFDAVVLATPWQSFSSLMQFPLNLESSPITGVHTWWDRPWLAQPHAILIDRLCQWVFPDTEAKNPTESGKPTETGGHSGTYYQIVISGSRELPKGDPEQILKAVRRDLAEAFPESAVATLLRGKVVTDPNSVFSVTPSHEQNRLSTDHFEKDRIWLAGDWTDTGWPATMEGALRSGALAAESVLAAMGRPAVLFERNDRS